MRFRPRPGCQRAQSGRRLLVLEVFLLTLLTLGVFLGTLVASFALTREVRRLATKWGVVAWPTEQRHVHSAPIPRLGGVAIYAAFVAGTLIALFIGSRYPGLAWTLGLANQTKSLLAMLTAGTLVFGVGVYDDLRSASAAAKFSVQAIAGALLFFGGLRILDVPVLFGANHPVGWLLGLPLTIVWVIGITNAFNLIDGLDGLAAGSALFSTLVVFVVSLVSGASLVVVISAALAGAILGFLRFNFNPATIFLGDSGSLFIGFMLSALALQGAQKASTAVAVAIPVVSFGLPILETALSVLRRWLSGRPVFTADREHIHHKLLELGYSHRQVVIVLYAVSAVFGLLSLFLLWPSGRTVGLVLTVIGIGVWLGVQHLGYLEFGELQRVAMRTIEQRVVVINNLALRRAAAELGVATDYNQVCRILQAAFGSNDFDGFQFIVFRNPNSRDYPPIFRDADQIPDALHYDWRRPGIGQLRQDPAWELQLPLTTTMGRPAGALLLYRAYADRPLLVDINLLVLNFPGALSEAVARVLKLEAQTALAEPDGEAASASARIG